MSTQETAQKAQQFIQELRERRNYVSFLSIYKESKSAFDIVLDNAVQEVAQRHESADVSVTDFLAEVYTNAEERLTNLEKEISGIENARVYLVGDFKEFVEEVEQRESREQNGERRG